MPDLHQDLPPVAGSRAGTESEGSVSLFTDDDVVRVVLHGSIDHHVRQDIRDLVDDLVSDAASTARRPVHVLARDVTAFALPGVWLLLELRRGARPAAVRVLEPSPAVRAALALHGLESFLPNPEDGDRASAAGG